MSGLALRLRLSLTAFSKAGVLGVKVIFLVVWSFFCGMILVFGGVELRERRFGSILEGVVLLLLVVWGLRMGSWEGTFGE